MRARLALPMWFVLFAGSALADAPSSNAMLDGRIFRGEIRDEKGVVQDRDVLSFKNGKFHSVTCERMGFGETPYWTRTEGNIVHFLVEAEHPENGRLRIIGRATGDQVEADGVWTKERWYWTLRQEIRLKAIEMK